MVLKKLITTNPHVKEYDFYQPENILIVDRYNPVITKEFLNVPWKDISEEIYKKYSISSWFNTIFALMKILVTGANGYIGRHVVRALLDKGADVIACDIVCNNIDECRVQFS